MAGITSVTLRHMDAEQILLVCRECGIDQIEWGGDIHVPPGDTALAERIRKASEENRINISSYGSYYRLGSDKNMGSSNFAPILETAGILGAPLIRVWAGEKSYENSDEDYRKAVTEDLIKICQMADKMNIAIGLEYHRNTFTQTLEGTLELLKAADCPNLYTYWQINPELSHEMRKQELMALKSKLCGIHVFFWSEQNQRLPLSDGYEQWQEYRKLIPDFNGPFLLEFVKEDSILQLKEDSRVLKTLLEM